MLSSPPSRAKVGITVTQLKMDGHQTCWRTWRRFHWHVPPPGTEPKPPLRADSSLGWNPLSFETFPSGWHWILRYLKVWQSQMTETVLLGGSRRWSGSDAAKIVRDCSPNTSALWVTIISMSKRFNRVSTTHARVVWETSPLKEEEGNTSDSEKKDFLFVRLLCRDIRAKVENIWWEIWFSLHHWSFYSDWSVVIRTF